jgi:zinc protease
MNLREEKHWSYGAFTFFRDAKGQRPFVTYAPVQTDKTKEALVELRKELLAILTDRPPTPEELAGAKSELTLTLPGRWETMAAISGALADIVTFDLDDRYYDTYGDEVRSQTVATVQAAAKAVIHPENLVWVVVGDRSKIEAGIRELNLGELRFIDVNGKPLGAS